MPRLTTDIFPAPWAPAHPDRMQLYSLATPNGQKIAIALEEIGLPYEAHTIRIFEGEQFDPQYLAINPNAKIPSIIDPDGPAGRPIALMESGAILLYLAEKTGKLLPTDPLDRWDATQWLFFQMANVGPLFGQFGHFFKFARGKTSDEYALQRYSDETKRLLGVLDRRLGERDYLAGGGYSIADIATFPWINALDFYGGKDHLGFDAFTHVQSWVDRCMARPAVLRGVEVCSLE